MEKFNSEDNFAADISIMYFYNITNQNTGSNHLQILGTFRSGSKHYDSNLRLIPVLILILDGFYICSTISIH